MKKLYRNILIVIIAIIAFFVFIIYSGILSAGSYPYSQTYKFPVNKDTLISRIRKFKENNPTYDPPKDAGLTDGMDENGNFYNCWVYYPQQNKIVFFVILGDNDNVGSSSIWLIRINDGLTLGHWGTINDNIGRSENLKQKELFRTEILDKLKLNYKDDGNNAFVFWK
jgi:hypothetical protein